MKREHFILILALAIALVLIASTATKAQEAGRYWAVSVESKENPMVLVLDTKEGHLWLWERSVREEEKDVFRITYQGRLEPGERFGEVMKRGRPKEKK